MSALDVMDWACMISPEIVEGGDADLMRLALLATAWEQYPDAQLADDEVVGRVAHDPASGTSMGFVKGKIRVGD
jgi:hypothetical protein